MGRGRGSEGDMRKGSRRGRDEKNVRKRGREGGVGRKGEGGSGEGMK